MSKVYDIAYTTRPDFRLMSLVKNDNGDKEVKYYKPPFKPYCFIEKKDIQAVKWKLSESSYDLTFDAPTGYARVEAETPQALKNFRYDVEIQTFEADIPFARRVMIDEEIGVNIPDKEDILYFDIEVNASDGFPEPKKAEKRILSIACRNGVGEEWFICEDDERDTLEKFFEVMKDHFVLVGWNSIRFDWPYVENRAKMLNISYNPYEFIHVDLLPLYKYLIRKNNDMYSLDAVGQRELGMSKETQGEEDVYSKLDTWFEEDREKLKKYNMEDARITEGINAKYEAVELLFQVSRTSHVRPRKMMYHQEERGSVKVTVGKCCDSTILKIARKQDYVFPNRGRFSDLDFPGGHVFDPVPGIYTDACNCDFSAMYPSLIMDFNVGPNTWHEDDSGEIQAANGSFDAHDKKKSILAIACEELLAERAQYKDKKKAATRGSDEYDKWANLERGIKLINNSLFGIFASPYHRYYYPGMSENITELGQMLIKETKNISDRFEDVQQFIYGDTDSVILALNADGQDTVEVAKRVATDLTTGIRNLVEDKYNAKSEHLLLEVDEVFSNFLITDKKKKYAGIVIWDSGPCCDYKVMGFAKTRTDWPDCMREFQMDLIDELIRERDPHAVIREYKDKLFKGQFDHRLTTHTGLSKHPDKYDTKMPHTRAAEQIAERDGEGALRIGDKIPHIKYGPNKTDVIPTDEGIQEDWRPNEGYCMECDEVYFEDSHEHELEEYPHFRSDHYSYLWDSKFSRIMERLSVQEHKQTGLEAWA